MYFASDMKISFGELLYIIIDWKETLIWTYG